MSIIDFVHFIQMCSISTSSFLYINSPIFFYLWFLILSFHHFNKLNCIYFLNFLLRWLDCILVFVQLFKIISCWEIFKKLKLIFWGGENGRNTVVINKCYCRTFFLKPLMLGNNERLWNHQPDYYCGSKGSFTLLPMTQVSLCWSNQLPIPWSESFIKNYVVLY